MVKRLLLLLLATSALFGAERLSTNKPAIKELPGGQLAIGQVILDRAERTVTFPALVNMQTGLVEYVVVHSSGKVHESVLKTEADPLHIHTAMLLLGAKTAEGTDPAVFFDAKRSLPGERVDLFASWKSRKRPLQELVFNKVANVPMSLTNWAYNGSATVDGKFLAERDGSIISLIADPSALINNPREDRENDELWIANTNTVPPLGTAVQVTIQLNKRP